MNKHRHTHTHRRNNDCIPFRVNKSWQLAVDGQVKTIIIKRYVCSSGLRKRERRITENVSAVARPCATLPERGKRRHVCFLPLTHRETVRSIARILHIHLTLPLILTTTILCETPNLTLPDVESSLYDVRIILFRNCVELMVNDLRHWSLSHTASKTLVRIIFSNIFIFFSTDLHIVQVSEV